MGGSKPWESCVVIWKADLDIDPLWEAYKRRGWQSGQEQYRTQLPKNTDMGPWYIDQPNSLQIHTLSKSTGQFPIGRQTIRYPRRFGRVRKPEIWNSGSVIYRWS